MYQNDTFIAVFAAGNQGERGMSTINSPGTAKNVISGICSVERSSDGQFYKKPLCSWGLFECA